MGKRRGRGEGNVEQLPSGSWRAALPGRKRAGRSATFATAGEARAWLRANADKPPPPPGLFSEWLDRWLELHRGRVAAHTYGSDRSLVNKHVRTALGSVRLRDLDALTLETYLAGLRDRVSPDLRHRIGKTLRKILNAAVRPGGLIPVSPMRGVAIPPAPKPRTRALTPEELAAVLAAADARGWGLMFRAWVELGLRPGELIGLRWGDLDAAGRVHVARTIDPATNEAKPPKTPREAPVPLTPELAAELAAARGEPDAPMFPARRSGGHWWKGNFLKFVWRPVMKAAGVKPGPQGRYVVRHTTASILLSAGASIVAVSKRLGHSTPDFTLRRYVHVMPTDQQRATDIMGEQLNRLSPRPAPRPAKPPPP